MKNKTINIPVDANIMMYHYQGLCFLESVDGQTVHSMDYGELGR